MGKQIGPYRVLGELGRGAMGVTYRAWSEAHRCEVALKLCAPGMAGQEESARLVREGRLLASVDHPFVVGVLDAGEHLAVPYLVMELVEGEDLAQRLRSSGPLEPLAAARLVRQIAEGTAELHRLGIVHRDLKPANVLLDRRGSPRVCDLGLARGNELTRLTETGVVLGTPAFLSPEQAAGEQAGPAADVYSLGAMLFELVTGGPPFTGTLLEVLSGHASAPPPSLLSVCPAAPEQLARIVACCLEKDPGDRYRSAAELAEALVEVAHPRAASGPPRAALVGGSIVGVLLALGVGWVATRPGPAPPPLETLETPAQELPAEPEVDPLLARAEASLRAGRFHDAWQTFEEVRDGDPKNAEAWAGLARTAAVEGRLPTALRLFLRALEVDPHQRKALLGAAVQLARLGDLEQAQAKLRTARELWGDAVDVEVASIQLDLTHGDAAPALRRAKRLVESAPEEAEPWFLLGQIHCNAKRFAEGLSAMQRAEELDPHPLHATFYVAQLRASGADLREVCDRIDAKLALYPDSAQLGRLQAALRFGRLERDTQRVFSTLNELCAREPMLVDLRMTRADFLTSAELRPDVAQADVDFVLEHEPGSPDALFLRLRLSQLQENAYGAWRAAVAYNEAEPTDAVGLRQRFECGYQAGQPADSEQAAEALWENEPAEHVATYLAVRHVLSGSAAAAQSMIDRGLQQFPSSPLLQSVDACRRYLEHPSPAAEGAVRAALDEKRAGVDALARFVLLSVRLEDSPDGDLSEPLRWGMELEAMNTRGPWVTALLAELYVARRQFADAHNRFDWALSMQPGNLDALDGLANLYLTCGGREEAVGLAQLVLHLARRQSKVPPERSRVLAPQQQVLTQETFALTSAELLERTTAALNAFDHARAYLLARTLVAREPDHARAWIALARVAGRRNLHSITARSLQRALAFAPQNQEALALLARIHIQQGQSEQAQNDLERLHALDPGGFAYREVQIYKVLGEEGSQAAQALARELRRSHPTSKPATIAWALVLAQRSPAEATAGLREHLQRDPVGRGWLVLASVFLDQGNSTEGRECLLRALDTQENHAEVFRKLAQLERKQGDLPAAIRAAQRGLPLNPMSAQLWFVLGACYGETGEHFKALEAMVRASGLATGALHERATSTLAVLEFELGDFASCKRSALRLRQLAPKQALGHSLLLSVARKEGKPEEAREHARALLACPDVSEAQRTVAERALQDPPR